MSKSIPIQKPLRTITQNELVRDLSERTCISENTIRVILSALADYVLEQLRSGNAVRIHKLSTYYLRCRHFSEERRRTFTMNNAHLPEFSYYPYAEISPFLRKTITTLKHQIDAIFHK